MLSPVVVDFETEAIKRRPSYPPKPVGCALKYPGDKQSKYYAWGHPDLADPDIAGNNCTKAEFGERLRDLWKSNATLLFQHAKFDTDVASVHFNLPLLPWERVHDTEYLLFLHDPHASTLSLKPSAQRILGWAPEERDELKEWITKYVPEAKRRPSEWGAYISKAPGRLVGRYANGDIDRTEGLFNRLFFEIAERGMLDAYNRERRLMPVLLRNEREGIRVDLRRMEKDFAAYEAAMEKADEWLRRALKVKDLNLDADADVAEALDRAGIITDWVYTAPTKRHPGGVRSIAKKNMPLSSFRNKRVAAVYGYRARLATCLSMFFRPWLEQARKTDGVIHTDWNQVRQSQGGARTARLSSSPNFQNIPNPFEDKDDDYAHPEFLNVPSLPAMRGYFLPEEGGVWMKRDYAQQEYRVFAHFENDHLMRRYNQDNDFDIHDEVGELLVKVANIRLQRPSVKIVNFGDLYGMGSAELAYRLKIPVELARKIKFAKRAALPGFRKLDEDLKARGRNGVPIRTWGGAEIFCEPPAISKKYNRPMTFEYKLLNYLIQRSSAECTKEATIYYDEVKKESRFLLTVHDEVDVSCPSPKLVKTEMAVLREVMESMRFDVPMLSDGSTGPNWGKLKDFPGEKRLDWDKINPSHRGNYPAGAIAMDMRN